jgi:uncharacterized protein (TIGR02145 family)
MNFQMKSLSLFAFLLLGCADIERNNPTDPGSDNYNPDSFKSSSGSLMPSSSSYKLSSSSKPASCPAYNSATHFCDARDGNVYKFIGIGTQIWMAENLNYNAANSICNLNMLSNCEEYGRLYEWVTAMNISRTYASSLYNRTGTIQGICPEGWHLPSKAEWNTLVVFAGGFSTGGTKLKAARDWKDQPPYGKGTDEYGFAALPGGYGNEDGTFGSVSYRSYWWASTESNSTGAYAFSVHYDGSEVDEGSYDKPTFYSIRCINNARNEFVSSSSSVAPSSSSAKTSSSSIVSSSSVPSSSSLACTAEDNDDTYYCSNGTMKKYGSVTDRDGQDYKTVEIGAQTWMAENLNYEVPGSECYDDDYSNCYIYGRLYNWATAMALPTRCNSAQCTDLIAAVKDVCPVGWHIPSNEDWNKLIAAVGGSSLAGIRLKAISGWSGDGAYDGNGKDMYGFAALPGGSGFIDSYHSNAGDFGSWWSALELNNNYAYYVSIKYDFASADYGNNNQKSTLYSIRCVKD